MGVAKPKKPELVEVKLPQPLCAHIERYLADHEELGYEDLEDFILNAVREKIEGYSHYSHSAKKGKGNR
jgi:hypothetical protein